MDFDLSVLSFPSSYAMLLCGSFLASGNYYCTDYFSSIPAFKTPVRHFILKPFQNVMRPNNVSTTPTAFIEMPVQRQGSVYLWLFTAEMFCNVSLSLRCFPCTWYGDHRGLESGRAQGTTNMNKMGSVPPVPGSIAGRSPKLPLVATRGGPMGLCGRWRCSGGDAWVLLAMQDGGMGASAPQVPD